MVCHRQVKYIIISLLLVDVYIVLYTCIDISVVLFVLELIAKDSTCVSQDRYVYR